MDEASLHVAEPRLRQNMKHRDTGGKTVTLLGAGPQVLRAAILTVVDRLEATDFTLLYMLEDSRGIIFGIRDSSVESYCPRKDLWGCLGNQTLHGKLRPSGNCGGITLLYVSHQSDRAICKCIIQPFSVPFCGAG